MNYMTIEEIRELLKIQIAKKRDLLGQMVGRLYSEILAQEIAKLESALRELEAKALVDELASRLGGKG